MDSVLALALDTAVLGFQVQVSETSCAVLEISTSSKEFSFLSCMTFNEHDAMMISHNPANVT